MELIAASRIVKAQQRVHAAVPYSEQITEVVQDLAAGGAAQRARRCSPAATRSRTTCYVVDHRRPRPVRWLQRRRAARRRGRDQGRRARPARTTRSSPSAARPRATSASATTSSTRAFTGFSDSPTYDDASAIGEHVVERFDAGEVDRVELVYTRFISAGIAGSRRCARSCRSTAETVAGGDGRPDDADGAAGGYEFEPDPATILDRCCRATSRPASTPRCSTPRRPSTPPASGR